MPFIIARVSTPVPKEQEIEIPVRRPFNSKISLFI